MSSRGPCTLDTLINPGPSMPDGEWCWPIQQAETTLHVAIRNPSFCPFPNRNLGFMDGFWRGIVVVQSLSPVQLFATPRTTALQASLSFTISLSLLKLMSVESMMPSNCLILCHPLFPSALNLSQHQGLFQWVSFLKQVAKVLELQLQHLSFQWIFRVDFL